MGESETMAKVTNSRAVQALYEKYVGDDPERVAAFERAASDSEVAGMIHDLRKKAKLSQKELADRVGTTQSVISRLEDADYDGHSLAMLRRVAAALGRRVEVHFPVVDSPVTPPRVRATKPPAQA
jgi:ribosome-binding protein aMBF1 (putative translation factor)